jgi:hypothetical protein
MTIFARNQKYEHGEWLKVKINIVLSTSFILIIIFFDGVFEYGGDSKF